MTEFAPSVAHRFCVGITSVFLRCVAVGVFGVCLPAAAASIGQAGEADWDIFTKYCLQPIESGRPFEIDFEDITKDQKEIEAELGQMSQSSILIVGGDRTSPVPTEEEFAQIVERKRRELERLQEYRVDDNRTIRVIAEATDYVDRSCSLDTRQDVLWDFGAAKWLNQWAEVPKETDRYRLASLERDGIFVVGHVQDYAHVTIVLQISTGLNDPSYTALENWSAN
ncbi:hypothetical protein [Roseobacter sp. A03A-229]